MRLKYNTEKETQQLSDATYLKSSIVYSNLPKQPFPVIETVINHKFCIRSADCPKLKKISFDAETSTPTY